MREQNTEYNAGAKNKEEKKCLKEGDSVLRSPKTVRINPFLTQTEPLTFTNLSPSNILGSALFEACSSLEVCHFSL